VSAGVPAPGPERPVLVFDGDCAFCTTSARWASRWLRLDSVEPWQRLDLAALGLDETTCQQALQWVAVDGSIQSAEWAVIAALRHAGGLWRVPAGVLAAPGVRVLAGVAYRWVARNRHRLPGGTPACRL
jgi:predicted DCC family thiol-disulfide oxidoreductase YuxK